VKEKMKSIRNIAAMIVLFSIAGATTALANKAVVVTNNTSYTMVSFFASSSDASTWDTSPSNNLYAGQSLAPGQQATITIGSGGGDGGEGDGCSYDLMAVLNGATQAAYTYSVNACSGGSWSITGM
jgi:hypothetical protein